MFLYGDLAVIAFCFSKAASLSFPVEGRFWAGEKDTINKKGTVRNVHILRM